MRTLEHLARDKQERIARETAEIYAPLANRLGMGRIKTELEDLCLQFLEPDAHLALVHALEVKRKGADAFIAEIRRKLETALADAGIEAKIYGRIKSVSSIYRKIRRQKIDVDQVYDYVAFRILTGSVKDCYGALGIVHSIWRPVPGRIKDFIAMPKPNMYQSLHTSVMTDVGQPFEVQIRTHEMHRIAEEGVAAHWQYKEDSRVAGGESERVAWLRHILEWQQETKDPREFLEMVKVDLYPDEVYAFTPKGKVLSFPRGATPVDFAYAHPHGGRTPLTGAKVNGRLVALRTPLGNGDIVEILTCRRIRRPRATGFLSSSTSRARHKIRQFIHTEEKREAVELGRRLLEQGAQEIPPQAEEAGAARGPREGALRLGISRTEDLSRRSATARLAPGASGTARAARTSSPGPSAARHRGVARRPEDPSGLAGRRSSSATTICSRSLAKCCRPLPGERSSATSRAGAESPCTPRKLPEREEPALRPGAPHRRRVGGGEEGRIRDRARGRVRGPAGPARRLDLGDRRRGIQHSTDRGARRGVLEEGDIAVSLEAPTSSTSRGSSRG